MAAQEIEHVELLTCNLCQRRYNADVYQRHVTANQCLKRNQQRLPFESIKQRSIQVGDQIVSVQQQQQQQKNKDTSPKFRQEKISNSNNATDNYRTCTLCSKRFNVQLFEQHIKHCQERALVPIRMNNRRRTLEEARQLLERRIKYKPPWPRSTSNQRRPTVIDEVQSKITRARNVSQVPSAKIVQPPHERPIPPTTKFKNDDLPIKISDRRALNEASSRPSILAHSPETRLSRPHQPLPAVRVDRTFSQEQPSHSFRPVRKAHTWTRPTKPPFVRTIISPIQIPTFSDSSPGPSHDRGPVATNRNYDDDEFERYSPTPPSSIKDHLEEFPATIIPPSVKQDFLLDEHQTTIRPLTYQKSTRTIQSEPETFPHAALFQAYQVRRKNKSTFHLPPLKLVPNTKYRTLNPAPWR